MHSCVRVSIGGAVVGSEWTIEVGQRGDTMCRWCLWKDSEEPSNEEVASKREFSEKI